MKFKIALVSLIMAATASAQDTSSSTKVDSTTPPNAGENEGEKRPDSSDFFESFQFNKGLLKLTIGYSTEDSIEYNLTDYDTTVNYGKLERKMGNALQIGVEKQIPLAEDSWSIAVGFSVDTPRKFKSTRHYEVSASYPMTYKNTQLLLLGPQLSFAYGVSSDFSVYLGGHLTLPIVLNAENSVEMNRAIGSQVGAEYKVSESISIYGEGRSTSFFGGSETINNSKVYYGAGTMRGAILGAKYIF